MPDADHKQEQLERLIRVLREIGHAEPKVIGLAKGPPPFVANVYETTEQLLERLQSMARKAIGDRDMTDQPAPDLWAVYCDVHGLWCVRETEASARDEAETNTAIHDKNPRVERHVSESRIRALAAEMRFRAAACSTRVASGAWETAALLIEEMLREEQSP